MQKMRIRWSNALAVGVAALDDDHKELFRLTNGVLEALAQKADRSVVAAAVQALDDCARHHFSREEHIIREAGYQRADAHHDEHERLLKQLQEIANHSGDEYPTDRITKILQSWILDHILVVDMDYARLLGRQTKGESLDAAPDRVLIVGDSRFFSAVLEREIRTAVGLHVDSVGTFTEARAAVHSKGREYVAAVFSVVLPDAADGAMVGLCREADIPAIVFTSAYSDALRDRLTADGVIDYILKSNPTGISQITTLVRRLVRNHRLKALVVDDSTTSREYLSALLRQHRFNVLTATNGNEAIAVLQDHPDIRLVVTDYHMPAMDGLQMIPHMRVTHPKDRLAIIGVSSGSEKLLSAYFLKAGANDFLRKPFLPEEFNCRITQNMELLDRIEELRDASTRDYLTGLYNRRHFYDVGQTLFASMKRGTISMCAAVIDVDHFKKINDTYGHDAGDQVLKALARNLGLFTRKSDVIARLGGEEFACLAVDVAPSHASTHFERLRSTIAATEITVDGQPIPITASIGVYAGEAASLHDMLSRADAMLYRAKAEGRNRVVVGGPDEAVPESASPAHSGSN